MQFFRPLLGLLSVKSVDGKNNSPSGTRTRAFRVKAEYPSHLDQWGAYMSLCVISTLKPVPHISLQHFSDLYISPIVFSLQKILQWKSNQRLWDLSIND